MSEYIVSIEIDTQEACVSEISNLLRIAGSPSSHDQGQEHPSGDVWESTTWKLESALRGDRGLEEHVDELLAIVAPLLFRSGDKLPKDRVLSLNIEVLYKTLTCGISLTAAQIRLMSRLGMSLDVTTSHASP